MAIESFGRRRPAVVLNPCGADYYELSKQLTKTGQAYFRFGSDADLVNKSAGTAQTCRHLSPPMCRALWRNTVVSEKIPGAMGVTDATWANNHGDPEEFARHV